MYLHNLHQVHDSVWSFKQLTSSATTWRKTYWSWFLVLLGLLVRAMAGAMAVLILLFPLLLPFAFFLPLPFFLSLFGLLSFLLLLTLLLFGLLPFAFSLPLGLSWLQKQKQYQDCNNKNDLLPHHTKRVTQLLLSMKQTISVVVRHQKTTIDICIRLSMYVCHNIHVVICIDIVHSVILFSAILFSTIHFQYTYNDVSMYCVGQYY